MEVILVATDKVKEERQSSRRTLGRERKKESEVAGEQKKIEDRDTKK